MYIYILTNKVNRKKYVGQSVNHPTESKHGRIKLHFYLTEKGCSALHSAIKKYGKENFVYEIVEYQGASQESLNAIERWYVKKENSVAPNGYNLETGGKNKGRASAETCTKIGIAKKGNKNMLGKKHSPETREKIRKKLTGKKLSDETKAKLKGRVPWNKGKKGLQTAWNKGKPMSEEQKGKVSKGLKKYYRKQSCNSLQLRLFD